MGGRAQDILEGSRHRMSEASDGGNSGRFRRFYSWLLCYELEVGLGVLVVVVSGMILYIMDTAPDYAFTTYQAMMAVSALMILLVTTAIMFNSARTRESAAELLEELRKGGDDGGE